MLTRSFVHLLCANKAVSHPKTSHLLRSDRDASLERRLLRSGVRRALRVEWGEDVNTPGARLHVNVYSD